MSATALAVAIFRAMLVLAPPARALPAMPGFEETIAEREERYHAIADAAAKASKGNRRDAAIVIAIWSHEAAFAKDVDVGPCYRETKGTRSRCDFGKAFCLGQVHPSAHPKWIGAELFADREKCFAATLEIARSSMKACSTLGPDHAFDVYSGGACLDGLALNQTAHVKGAEIVALIDRVERMLAPVSTAAPKGAP